MQGSSSLQKQPGSGCKAHPCKKIWGYLSGIAQRGRFKTMPVPPQAFAGPVSPMLQGWWEDTEFQRLAPLHGSSGEWSDTVPSIPAAGGGLGCWRCWERLGEAPGRPRWVSDVSSAADTSLDNAGSVWDEHVQGTRNVLLPDSLEHSCTERLSDIAV